jgi:hypothetical protein
VGDHGKEKGGGELRGFRVQELQEAGNRKQETGTARVQEAGFRVQELPLGHDLDRHAVPVSCFLFPSTTFPPASISP